MSILANGIIPLVPGAVAVGTPWVSDEILLQPYQNDPARRLVGSFSLDLTFTGVTRTLAATILVSNGASFVAYEGANAIFTGKSAGHIFASFSLPVCRAFKIVLTATTNTCTVTECIVAMA